MSDLDDRQNRTRSFLVRKFISTGMLHIVLTLFSLSLAMPFVWMALTGFKTLDEVGLESWIPNEFIWSNYLEVFETEGIQFGRWYWNSIYVAAFVTLLQVFTSSLAAFSFARLQWPGRDKAFLLYLGTMMLPWLVMMVPNYQLMIKLGIVDTYAGLIIPASFSAFGTFLLRQFMLGIPSSLDEAAEIDGANKWQLFWDVILPLARPGLVTLSIFTFIGNYHSFFLAVGDDEKRSPLYVAGGADVF
jgi:ABC-type glycerol-3-phosphate transport system permease component